jgi:hypothetical protein
MDNGVPCPAESLYLGVRTLSCCQHDCVQPYDASWHVRHCSLPLLVVSDEIASSWMR